MMMELSDFLGVLAVALYLAGVGAVTVRALMLRARQRPEQGRGGFAFLLVLVGGLYILFVAADAPSVLSILGNQVDDIPPASTARTALIAAWLWLLHTLLYRLARGRLK